MPDSRLLFDALLDDLPSPVPAAVREVRRSRQSRRRAASLVAVIMLAGGLASVWFNEFWSRPQEAKVATAVPGFHLFSTAETPFSLRRISTSEMAHPVALFSNRDIRLTFHEIDDYGLLELLQPYAPVIVYLGRSEQPTLLFLNHAP